jgi:hypothetical protein
MMSNIGELKLLDFGFARRQPFDPWVGEATSDERTIASTPAYASAERVNGEEPQSSDDLYSLACIAYELLSGQHPFGGRSAPLARAHGREPQRPAGLRDSQWAALQTALRWGRGERRIDVSDLVTALVGSAAAPAEATTSRERPKDVQGSPMSRWALTIGFAALLVAAVGVTLWVVTGKGFDSPGELGSIAEQPQREAPAPVAPSRQSATPSVAPAQEQGAEQPAVMPAAATQPASPAPAAATNSSEPTGAASTLAANAPPVVVPVATAGAQPVTPPAAAMVPAPTDAPASQGVSAGPGVVQFDKDTYATTENDGIVKLTVRRSGDLNREARFQWRLQSNSAEAGQDFADLGATVDRILPGNRTVTVSVPLVRDSVSENTELFLVELLRVDGGPGIGEQSTAAVIIVDDD